MGLGITLYTDHVECNRGNTLPLLQLITHCLNGKEMFIVKFIAGAVTLNPRHSPGGAEPRQCCHCSWQGSRAQPWQGWWPRGAAAPASLPGTHCTPPRALLARTSSVCTPGHPQPRKPRPQAFTGSCTNSSGASRATQ